MYAKILVGIDGSPHGDKALETGSRLAEACGANLFIFHAIRHYYPTPPFPWPQTFLNFNIGLREVNNTEKDLEQIYEESGRQVIAAAKKQVEYMKLNLAGKVEYNLETIESPADYAERFAKENNIDLIVLGCLGHHSRARNMLMGTVATHILNNAPCNVLIVR